LGLAFAAYVFYRILLKNVSRKRHEILHSLFFNLILHVSFSTFFFAAFWVLQWFEEGHPIVARLIPYIGLIALIGGSIVLVKIARIFLFEYLFLGHMKEGVPVLLVNLLSLLLSLILAGWIASDIFGVRLTPVLATSAIFSIVLGLALQDTLGNLFAGIALQLDKPYEIGDWIEVNNGDGTKRVGQVLEISWRSTLLIAFTDESITIPNRIMAQAQISNFSPTNRPIIRSQSFRIPYGSDSEKVKATLLRATNGVPQLLRQPEPLVLISETTESWVTFKVVYYIENYGSQYLIADQLIESVLKNLEDEKMSLAAARLQVIDRPVRPAS
jgi:small-conductance mechanosensitive channel